MRVPSPPLYLLLLLVLILGVTAEDVTAPVTPVPHRWKSFLPAQQLQSQRRHPSIQVARPVDHHYNDYNEDEDEDDSEERHIRAYLRYKTRNQGKEVIQTAKQAGQAGQAVLNDTITDHAPSGHSVNRAIVSLFKLIPTTLRLIWLSAKLASRYALYAIRLGWSTSKSITHFIYSTFLSILSTTKYVTLQLLRPVRVVAAPIIYIYLGAKLVLVDTPLYYTKAFLRETYPIYVFTGAALSLGTLIGIACSIVLWVGHHVFSNGSEFEHVVMSWQSGPPTAQRKKKDKGKSPKRHISPDRDREDRPDYLSGLGKSWKPLPRSELARRRQQRQEQQDEPVDYFSLGRKSLSPTSSTSSSPPISPMMESILSPNMNHIYRRTTTPGTNDYHTAGSTTSSGGSSTGVNTYRSQSLGHGPVGATGRKSSRHRRDREREEFD